MENWFKQQAQKLETMAKDLRDWPDEFSVYEAEKIEKAIKQIHDVLAGKYAK